MPKKTVQELAKKYGVSNKELVALLRSKNIPVKDQNSVLTEDQVNFIEQGNKKRSIKDQVEILKQKIISHRKEMAEKERPRSQQKNKKQPYNPNRNKKRDNFNKENNQNYRNKHAKNSSQQGQGQNQQKNKNNRNFNRQKGQSNQANTQERNFDAFPNQGKQQGRNNKFGRNSQSKKNNNLAGPTYSNNPHKQGKKQKKTYKDKKAERPIKLRDNRKKTKSKSVDYKKIKEERKINQKKNRIYEIPEFLTVGQLAETLEIPATEIIKELMLSGTLANINQQIDAETAEIVASELGYEVKKITTEDVFEKIFEDYDNLVTGNEILRPPVVTVMGHVDHGKTSLLDRIRKTNVTAGEAGGITQHIGAYTVTINDQQITFIDTPGHAAFTEMRSRGAQVTDIAILVVAADDGVMPQTVEAINHSKAAGVPIIVAINKIDKDGANPERVKQELTEQDLVVEEWGGDVIAVPISAKKGTNIDELLENVLLVAEMEELKADPNRNARGSVIEAEVKKGKGPSASLLVKQGTLNLGDTILSGTTYGKVRTMIDDKGRRIRHAGPSIPVEISGLSGLPAAGDDFIVLEDEKEARTLAEQRLEQVKLEQQNKSRVNLDDLFNRLSNEEITDVNIIVKGDVHGSVEALSQSLEQLNTDEVRVNVVHSAVGAVNETDVMLATTSNAIIIAFNVRPDRIAREIAEKEEIDIRFYNVIYDAIDDVKKAMEGMLKPEYVEKRLGEAEIREVFRIPGGTMIAGSYVTDGKVTRNDQARLIRNGVVIYDGTISSLRRFKDDVKEVASGYECGIGIENMNDVKIGDVIETYTMEAIKKELG